MNELYICDTPYQLFNALNIAFNNRESIKTLLIISQFETAGDLAIQTQNSGLFEEVYLLNKDKTKFMEVGIKRSVHMAYDFLFPEIFIQKRFGDYQINKSLFTKFDIVYASGAFSTVAAILKINKQAKFIMFDDGLGSYSGDYITRSSGGKANRLFCKIFHVGSEVCRPIKLMVNNVELCKSTSVEKKDIVPLPKLSEEFLTFCESIFQGDSNVDMFNMIWLTQPLDSTEGGSETRDSVKQVLLDYNNVIGVRMHPREKDVQYYSEFTICDNRNLWELYLLKKDTEKLSLISYYSSAQFTPKQLFNLEPIVVFTYSMNGNIDRQEKELFDSSVQELKKVYSAPEKIKVPETDIELRKIMNELVNISV